MSCIDLSDDQRRVLELLTQGQPVPDDLAPAMDELVRWGWVMERGEVTGVGWAHIEDGRRGRVGIHDRYEVEGL